MNPESLWMPLPLETIEHVLVDTFEYRLHTIKIKHEGATAVAHIYDGPADVCKMRGSDLEQALSKAKHWIDEQDEVTPVYDLKGV